MGFVTWFLVEVDGAGPGGTLRVSNDVLDADYVLDASIRVDLVAGATASTFSAVLVDLPADVADALAGRHRSGGRSHPPSATIGLGYLDDPGTRHDPVLRGVVTSVRTRVNTDGQLETELRGTELAGHWLQNTRVSADRAGDRPLSELVRAVAEQAGRTAGSPGAVTVPEGSGLPSVPAFTLRHGNGLAALRAIADAAGAPLVVADGGVLIGGTVGRGEPLALSAEHDIVDLDRFQDENPAEAGPLTSVELVTLGNPAIRVGRAVRLSPAELAAAVPGPLRVERVRHTFSTAAGYTCTVTVAAVRPGQRASRPTGVHGVVERIRDLAGIVHEGRPAVDVGEVSGYDDGAGGRHVATLHYGQTPDADTVAPSVETPVDREPELHGMPVASPFAFHRCGLVVPVLPGMRALLAHNRGLVNDAVVAGFVWSEQPRLEPPRNADGDWWLCLPTELDGDGMPAGKGVNDLTDRAGQRVLQAKGLRITVGEGTLPDVGARPDVPSDLDGTLRVEHESGTTLTVDGDGAVTLDAGGQDVVIRSGAASITLSGGKLTLRGTSVEVA